MQQIYGCWSYWQMHKNRQAVLKIVPAQPDGLIEKLRYHIYAQRNKHNPFLVGIFSTLKEVFHVKILQERDESVQNATTSVRPLRGPEGYKMLSGYNHTAALRDGLIQHYTGQPAQSCLVQPRIAILNRKKKRNLINAKEIQQALSRKLGINVAIEYFEDGANFQHQVEFFCGHDIIISPHGAQLAGLPFMPTCSGILELFPHNFLFPLFFGSLAAAANLHYTFMYLGEESLSQVQALPKEIKTQARNGNLCPAIPPVVEAVRRLEEQWKECCNAQRR